MIVTILRFDDGTRRQQGMGQKSTGQEGAEGTTVAGLAEASRLRMKRLIIKARATGRRNPRLSI
jgi:hypothetical protein